MMQDTILTMCRSSVTAFVHYILKFCPTATEIVSTREVKNVFNKKMITVEDSDYEEVPFTEIASKDMNEYQSTIVWLHSLYDKNKDPEPLFDLDLILKQGNLIPTYSTNPEEVVTKIMKVFDEGVEILQKIPQLEPILLKHLFKNNSKKMLKAPIRPKAKPSPVDPNKKSVLPDENTWLWEAGESIEEALKTAIQPLYEYVQTFSQFDEENKLNPDKYIKQFEGEDNGEEPADASTIRADIFRIRKLEEELKERIPENVIVSIFRINIKDIRNMYVGKYNQIVDKEIKLISQRATENNYKISNKFAEIETVIRKVPKNIEELTETKKYISEIGIVIEKLKKEIDECMATYNICEEFDFEFSSTENDNKWKLYGAPLGIIECIQSQTTILEKQREQFIKQMEEEQDEFEETLDGLLITVEGFGTFNDIAKYMEIAENVESVNERLQESLETLFVTFNS
jgi:dynein heavy chain